MKVNFNFSISWVESVAGICGSLALRGVSKDSVFQYCLSAMRSELCSSRLRHPSRLS